MSDKQNSMQERSQRKISRRKQHQPKLLFPAHRARQFLRNGNYANRYGRNTPIALAAIIQYLTLEILDLTVKIALKFGRRRIQPRHLLLAIRMDDELNKILSHITVAQGGVIPMIKQ